MATIYLSLGSNIGDRRRNLERALIELERSNINVVKKSSLYETEPVGPKQRRFYNMAGKFCTKLLPKELLKSLKQIEKNLGRKKTFKWGPRVIDIDILFYGKQIIKTKNLIIPHKEIACRYFVLVPMSEIAPHFVHPVYKKTISTLLKNIDNKTFIKTI